MTREKEGKDFFDELSKYLLSEKQRLKKISYEHLKADREIFKDFEDMYKPLKSYALVKKLHAKYVKEYGSCRCYDVQEKSMGRTFNLWNADEMKEAFKAGMMENCSTLVGNVAKLATKIILRNGFKPKS